MKAMAQKFGGGGQQPSPAQAAAELAGKRLIPGHALPHVVLHTVQVCRTHTAYSQSPRNACVTSFDTSNTASTMYLLQPSILAPLHHLSVFAAVTSCFCLEPRAASVSVFFTTLVLPLGHQLNLQIRPYFPQHEHSSLTYIYVHRDPLWPLVWTLPRLDDLPISTADSCNSDLLNPRNFML